MSIMNWNETDYGTGVGFADDQHQELFSRINALHDAIPAGDKAVVGEKLSSLIDYTVEHFTAEETAMKEKGFDGYDAHKSEHDAFVKICVDLQTKFNAGEAEVTQDATALVKGWLDNHIPNIDRLYTPTLG